MSGKIALRPSYWASVSGGKDSLYMLNYILHNLDRYPLNGVVHFELEIDYPFIHDVIDYMESECKRFGIRFVRINPEKLGRNYIIPSATRLGIFTVFPLVLPDGVTINTSWMQNGNFQTGWNRSRTERNSADRGYL